MVSNNRSSIVDVLWINLVDLRKVILQASDNALESEPLKYSNERAVQTLAGRNETVTGRAG